jgi:D-alanine transaminase
MLVYLNGAYLDKSAARVSVDDRGFLFGDGVYEVTRAIDGRLFAAERHFHRLARGMRELELPWPPGFDETAITAVSERLLAENDLRKGDAMIYLQITRGGEGAPRTHAFPPAGTAPTVYMAASRFTPPDDARARGATAITVPDLRWERCDVKTIQLLANVLAKQRAAAAGAFEAIQVRDDVMTEGAHTNVFAVLDGVVRTHPTGRHILPGVTRDIVLELARDLKLPVQEEAVPAAQLPRAAELFLTGTTTDVLPIVRLDGQPVGDGRPGAVAQQLHAALSQRLRPRVLQDAPQPSRDFSPS